MTRREEIIRLLEQNELSVFNLAEYFRVPIPDIIIDLGHVLISVKRTHKVTIMPPRCRSCGFAFKERSKTRPPSKCPKCHSESIDAARYKFERVSAQA